MKFFLCNSIQFAEYGKNWTKGADYFRMDGSTNAQNRKASQAMFNDEENFRYIFKYHAIIFSNSSSTT